MTDVRPPTIVAMGGGGFSTDPDDPRLDDYILGLTGVARPRVCFVPTASGDAEEYCARFLDAFSGRARPSLLRLFARDARDLRAQVLQSDVVYVGGGSTANLLAVWRLHGLGAIMREAWQRGVVLCGVSAGAICSFEACLTDSFGPLAPLHDGLGLLPGSACPHYDGEADRRPAYHAAVADGLPGGLALDDGAAARFAGTELAEIVASRPGARGYRVALHSDGVIETPLPARVLGATTVT